ncbi:MAG TPA: cupredoxin domain-containing protein [Candidatus Limnocylindrales bacterium]|nr:cupredoxin domain-containing protein [Candidatus Limnocylindrales bacterium]
MRTRSTFFASIIAAVAFAACAGADSPQLTPPGGDPATPPAGTGDATGQQVTVTVQNNMFEPQSVTVPRGGHVTWSNEDQANHTATHGTGGEAHGDPLFDMPLSPGTEASYTFAEAGSFPVTCTIHPRMQMDVTVTP